MLHYRLFLVHLFIEIWRLATPSVKLLHRVCHWTFKGKRSAAVFKFPLVARKMNIVTKIPCANASSNDNKEIGDDRKKWRRGDIFESFFSCLPYFHLQTDHLLSFLLFREILETWEKFESLILIETCRLSSPPFFVVDVGLGTMHIQNGGI